MAGRNRKIVADLDPLLRASKVFSAAITVSLDGVAELSMPELRTLAIIERGEPLNMSSVAEYLGVNPSNASRACERLVARGLLERSEDPADRRHVVLRLSPAGRKMFGDLMRRRAAVLRDVVARMRPEDQQALAQALTAFTTAADDLTAAGEFLSDDDGHLLRWLG